MQDRVGVLVLTIDAARRVLGIDPRADPDEVRAAFRQRIRELHPDVSGDAGPENERVAREVIDAYRRLCEPTVGHPTRQPAATSRPGEDLPDADRAQPIGQRGPSPRLVQVAMASVLVLGTSVFVVFFLVAFSQSGR